MIELLVVIGVIAILAGLLLPALSGAKATAQAAHCKTLMRQWGLATEMYRHDNRDRLPPMLNRDSMRGGSPNQPYYTERLAPYLSIPIPAEDEHLPTYAKTAANHKIRQCPAGSTKPPPYWTRSPWTGAWNCWIGANFGAYGDPVITAPYYYCDTVPPLNVERIPKPSDAAVYMDSIGVFIYTPADSTYTPFKDSTGDGIPDTSLGWPGVAYGEGRPTVHRNGSNVTLLDGHVEWVSDRKLWNIEKFRPTHSFWYLWDR